MDCICSEFLTKKVNTGYNQLGYAYSNLSYLEVIGRDIAKRPNEASQTDVSFFFDTMENIESKMQILDQRITQLREYREAIKTDRKVV